MLAAPRDRADPAQILPAAGGSLRRVGFERDEALLPHGPQSFSGYRLLREYFAFRQRFLFFEVAGLAGAVRPCDGDTADLLIVFKEQEPRLEGRVDTGTAALYCTPAINLFTRRTDRIALGNASSEFQVIVDRTRPFDFEVYEIEQRHRLRQTLGRGATVPAVLSRQGRRRRTAPSGAFYTVHRAPRQLTEKESQFGQRHTYTGTEAFLSLVDASNAPFRTELTAARAWRSRAPTGTCRWRCNFGLGDGFQPGDRAPVRRCVA